MSVKIRKSLITSAVVGVLACVSGSAVADPLEALHNEGAKIHKAGAKSQAKVDDIFEQGQVLFSEYRTVVDETENLKIYNDYVATLVADQQAGIDSLNSQIQEIEDTKKNVVPLMFKMIDTLEAFIKADVPIKKQERLDRVTQLRANMSDSNITVSERYRQVLEAYQIEKDMGSLVSTWQGSFEFGGNSRTVDYVNVGRVAYMALSLDVKNAWLWDQKGGQWIELDAEYVRHVNQVIRIASQQSVPELVKLPIFAAE